MNPLQAGKKVFVNKKPVKAVLVSLIIFALLIIFPTCCSFKHEMIPLVESPTSTFFYSQNTALISPTPINSQTPTFDYSLLTPTATMDLHKIIPNPTIGFTQIPPVIGATNPPSNIYLYKDVLVTFHLSDARDSLITGYLNLDDLNDTEWKNSDMSLTLTTGTNTFGVLRPVNQATSFDPLDKQNEENSGKEKERIVTATSIAKMSIGYSYCIEHLPEFGNYSGPTFFSGSSICFLTDEGRIAVVHYVATDSKRNEDGTINVTISVTVYQQKPKLP